LLDFQKLVAQVDQVGRESLTDLRAQEATFAAALAAYERAAADPDGTRSTLEQNLPWVLWPVALPIEPFGSSFAVAPAGEPVTVVAADGSQIMPSHHEIHNCYLLNVGTAVISYGGGFPPLLESTPRLYHRPEDLYPLVDRRRVHIDELYVSLERNLLELETLASLALARRDRGLPVVAFLDGSLISWSVEKMSDAYQETHRQRVVAVFESLREARLPLIGYLSHSRSADLVNDLRVCVCPYQTSHCRELCGSLNEEDFPCSTIWPLSDRQLLSALLPPGSRTAAFAAGASAARSLPSHLRACFCYLNVGFEVARLEFPRWLADDPPARDLALAVTAAQVAKGKGYPVSLAEAHHLAVIRGEERARFFELLERHLVSLGVNRLRVSPKETRKRTSLI